MANQAPAPANCKKCDGEILWVKRSSGVWHVPLINIGKTTILDLEGYPRFVDAFVRHYCDPQDVERHTQYLIEHYERISERNRLAKEEREERRRQWDEDRRLRDEQRKESATLKEQAERMAFKVDCPACPAKKGHHCLNLNLNLLAGRKTKNQKTHTAWPHPVRTILGEKEA